MGRIVVTGFEPFGGAASNASWEAVRLLKGVRTVLLPVSFTRAAEQVRALVREDIDGLICVGEAGGRSALSLERVAVNLMDARIPDNDGFQPVDQPVTPGGPAAYFSTLPLRRAQAAIREAGLPAELSCTAGTYVCNCVFYALMAAAAERARPIPAGFIHVPAGGIAIPELARGLQAAVEQLG